MSSQKKCCSNCFLNWGLREVASQVGTFSQEVCLTCESSEGKSIDSNNVEEICYRFFSDGTVHTRGFFRVRTYFVSFDGSRPSEKEELRGEILEDVNLLERLFNFSLRTKAVRVKYTGSLSYIDLWDVNSKLTDEIFGMILRDCKECLLSPGDRIFRVRTGILKNMSSKFDFDTPPRHLKHGKFDRFDSNDMAVFYCSTSSDAAIMEVRPAITERILLATISPTRTLKLLNLADDFRYSNTDHDSIELFLTGICNSSDSHALCRQLSSRIAKAGFDGFIHQGHFSQVSDRLHKNVVIFGSPIKEGLLEVESVNEVLITELKYSHSLGPYLHFDYPESVEPNAPFEKLKNHLMRYLRLIK